MGVLSADVGIVSNEMIRYCNKLQSISPLRPAIYNQELHNN
jgi:hypothetical protein